jgi:hypothetical protein
LIESVPEGVPSLLEYHRLAAAAATVIALYDLFPMLAVHGVHALCSFAAKCECRTYSVWHFLTLLIGIQAPASSVGSKLFVSEFAFAKDDEGQKMLRTLKRKPYNFRRLTPATEHYDLD